MIVSKKNVAKLAVHRVRIKQKVRLAVRLIVGRDVRASLPREGEGGGEGEVREFGERIGIEQWFVPGKRVSNVST